MDFGIAVDLRDDPRGQTKFMRQRRAISGTPHFIAPEVLSQDIGINDKLDIWSLGIIAYQLLTGSLPFEKSGSIDKLFDTITEGVVFNFDQPSWAGKSEECKDFLQ